MDASEFETLVTELETRVDRLRSLYEQYFMGIEKQIPAVPHKDVERRIQALRREQPRNTGMRFRFQMIIQRYNTFQSYWQRICREIEEGTYKRHIIRAKKKFAVQKKEEEPVAAVAVPPPEPGRTASGSYVLDLDAELEEYVSDRPPPPAAAPAPVVIPQQAKPLWRKAVPKPAPAPEPPPVAKPAAAAAPAPAPKPAPKAAPVAAKVEKKPGDVSDDRMRQLYAQYVQTKRAQKESTAKVTFADLAKTIRESTDKLRQKHAGKQIDFEVTVKDGKTVLKPVVK